MAKFDLSKIVSQVQSHFPESKRHKIGVGSNLKQFTDDDFIKLGEWWSVPTRLPGIPKGNIILIGGETDSGKTSFCIQATKAALDQGFCVLYAETEHKTTTKDFECWGVDPNDMILVQSSIAEELFEFIDKAWDSFKEAYPDVPLLVIIDSLGNIISKRDSEIDLTEQASSPGGKGKINRTGLSRMIAKADEDGSTLILVSYTYANMGSPGKVIAGGKAQGYFSILSYQTARKGWLEKTVQGKKVGYGAEVVWTLAKNHINKEDPGEKVINFRITKEGIEYVNPEKTKKPKPSVYEDMVDSHECIDELTE